MYDGFICDDVGIGVDYFYTTWQVGHDYCFNFTDCHYGGMFFLHLKASNEVKNGTEVGKTLSQGLGCLLLLGFPIGTVVGVFILINTCKKKWQTGAL